MTSVIHLFSQFLNLISQRSDTKATTRNSAHKKIKEIKKIKKIKTSVIFLKMIRKSNRFEILF